ncbi:MAG: FtsX-like permease family protein [Actinobacteria bacterium]|nr:MAG: FtsX-like permease family protein [Actinomycetota bacterium]
MLGLTWLRGLAARRRGRLLATAAGIAVAVGVLASIGSFLSASKATMTRRSIADVSVDWQVEAQPGFDPTVVLDRVRRAAGVRAALPVGFATTTGFEASAGGTTQTTGPGVVIGLPDGYRAAFPAVFRDLTGARAGVLVAQQTAANLHAAPGDTVTIGRAGMAPVLVRVDGVVDVPQADSFFQNVGAPVGAQPPAPPDNVLVMPADQWHAQFDPLGAQRPDLVHTQVHARLGHQLASDPSAAYAAVSGRARNLEVRLAGAGLVGDNLAATLGAARSDALYAQMLFLFLGLPGAVLAGMLTATVAGVGAERRRREQSLLRARGATTTQLVRLGVLEAAVVGLVGAAAGLRLARLVGRLAFGTGAFGATTGAAIGWASGAAVAGLAIAAATVAVPAWRDAREITVVAGRRSVGRATRRPRWARLGLDVWLLLASGVVFWLTGRGGYKLVLAPEGVPTISVSYWAFAGPALLWSGAALLAWRLADLVLGRGRGLIRRSVRPLAGNLCGTVAASMSRQRRLLARALVLVTLTASFALSTAVFNSTYRQQADVDARLTNGADVTVIESPGARVGPAGAARLAKVAGVEHVEPIQHRFAYVGADLQDLYGVRPASIVAATKLQDAYFVGGTARKLISTLSARPDSILVSAETVHDFQLRPGDRLMLRLQDARTKQLRDVVFHYAGVAKEFPTAPRDSFLVANADYVARTTGSDDVGSFLVDTGGASPQAVAGRIRAVVGAEAKVIDIRTSRRIIGSSLTSVDLAGLTKVELGFALVLAAAATGLVLALGLTERRRMFVIAGSLGARSRQLGAFIWAEAAFVALGGLLTGAIAGWALAVMLVKVLAGVFDPPPSTLAVPWPYLGSFVAVALVAVVVAAYGTLTAIRRPAIALVRDL